MIRRVNIHLPDPVIELTSMEKACDSIRLILHATYHYDPDFLQNTAKATVYTIEYLNRVLINCTHELNLKLLIILIKHILFLQRDTGRIAVSKYALFDIVDFVIENQKESSNNELQQNEVLLLKRNIEESYALCMMYLESNQADSGFSSPVEEEKQVIVGTDQPDPSHTSKELNPHRVLQPFQLVIFASLVLSFLLTGLFIGFNYRFIDEGNIWMAILFLVLEASLPVFYWLWCNSSNQKTTANHNM